MASNLTNSFNLLKDRQEGVVQNALSTFTSVFSRFPEHEGLTGKKTVRAIRHARPAGFALGPSADALPVSAKTKYSNTKIYPCYWYQTLAIDWDLIEQSKDQQGAFASIISDTMAAASESAVMRMERMSMGDGSGRLGTVASVTSSAGSALVITVSGKDNLPFFEEGERIQFMYDSTTSTLDFNTYSMRANPTQGWYEIDTTTRSGDTLTITCTSDSLHPSTNPPAATDTIIVAGSIAVDAVGGTTNAGHELNGLKILVDDGNQPVLTNTKDTFPAAATFQGLNSTNEWWQSKVVQGTGKYLNRTLVHEVADDISNHGSGLGADQIKMIVAHSFQIAKYIETLYPHERFSSGNGAGKFQAGSDTMFNQGGGPMIGDKVTVKNKYCDKSIAYLIGDGCERLTLRPWGFYDNDGTVFRPDPQNRPRDVATAFAYLQLATTARNRSGRIENLKTT